MTAFRTGSLFAIALGAVFVVAGRANADPHWIRRFGTSGDDRHAFVSADSDGNAYVAGRAAGDLYGPSAGGSDAILSKYDSEGNLLWGTQFGSETNESSAGVSADDLGNVFVGGSVFVDPDGDGLGTYDGFVAKYDTSGGQQWTRQIGTDGLDYVFGLSSDSLGNVYVSGSTNRSLGGPNDGGSDAFVAKYDTGGTLQWTEQFGTGGADVGWGVSADTLGNVYVSGYTTGALGAPNAGEADAYLAKFDSAGTLQWTRQMGTGGYDESVSVWADSLGYEYIVGRTDGALEGLSAGSSDAYVAKYDSDGTLLWTEQFGTDGYDRAFDVTSDSVGNVYVAGFTTGDLSEPVDGYGDAYLAKFSPSGTLLWTDQFGSDYTEVIEGVSLDPLGNIFVAGSTLTEPNGPAPRDWDAFVARYPADFPIPGDGNLDGKVDGLDYVAWAINFGTNPVNDPPGTRAKGDFNDDGVVDGLDYMIWAANFGNGPNDAVAIPEPVSLALTTFGIAVLINRRRRR